MIQKITTTLLFALYFLCSYAQEVSENRLVYNRLEYFFNTKQTDSIYALGNEKFKEQIPLNDFKNVLNYFYKFGTIKDAKQVTQDNTLIGYNIEFQSKKCYLQLAVDSSFHFTTLILKEEPFVETVEKYIIPNVVKTSTIDQYIDSIAKTYLTNVNTASLAIGIIRNNKVNSFFYGETVKGDKNSLPNPTSIYEIGSISKIFTAVLLADLVEKNILSLDDSIINYLPDSLKTNTHLHKITFKQLANHTSGLPRLPTNLEQSNNFTSTNPYSSYTQKDLYSLLKNIQINSEPGENYEYSNLGYGLLGDILSTITKKTYAQNIKEIITIPLNLGNTVEKIDPKIQKLVNTYNKNGENTPAWDFQALAGAGSLKSSLSDLLRFVQYQFKMPENELENAMALTRQFTFFTPPNTDIGLGWHMNMTNDLICYWHNGGTGGSSSFIAIVPDLKSAIVVLSNSAHSVDSISEQIFEKVLNKK